MTSGTGERLYRACQRCRARKSRCDLCVSLGAIILSPLIKSRNSIGELGRPPCLECLRTGHDCTLAGSRRGGDYSHRKTKIRNSQALDKAQSSARRESPLETQLEKVSSLDHSVGSHQNEVPMYPELKNPFDALQILAKAAAHDTEPPPSRNISASYSTNVVDYSGSPGGIVPSDYPGVLAQDCANNGGPTFGIKDYRLVMNGTLQSEIVLSLIHRLEHEAQIHKAKLKNF
jgi:hypothetical protein